MASRPEVLNDITQVIYPVPEGSPLVFLRTSEVFGKEASHLIGRYRIHTFEEGYIDPQKAREDWENSKKSLGLQSQMF